MGNYRAFIAASDELLVIRDEVSSIDKHLESLVVILTWLYWFWLGFGLGFVMDCVFWLDRGDPETNEWLH